MTDVAAELRAVLGDRVLPGEEEQPEPVRPDELPRSNATLRALAVLEAVRAELPGGGEPRPQQAAMTSEIAERLATNEPAAVQAGTGVGKSFGAIIPHLLQGGRFVVATATIALQEQLAKKDLPFLLSCEALPPALRKKTFAVVKGRSNYVCRAKLAEITDPAAGKKHQTQQAALFEPEQERAGGEESDLRTHEKWKPFSNWISETSTGDRSEMPFEPDPRFWAAVSAGPDECTGNKCPYYYNCFGVKALAAADEADIIVVNMHLYAMHVASGFFVLPEHDRVVFDEAHELENVLNSAFGNEVNPRSVQGLAYACRSVFSDAEVPEKFLQAAERLEEEIKALELKDMRLTRPLTEYEGLNTAIALTLSRIESTKTALRTIADRLGENDKSGPKIARLRQRCANLEKSLQDALEATPGKREIVWREDNKIKLVPLDVAPMLRSTVWPEVTPTLVSATLPPDTPRRLGLDDTRVLDVGSPFDFPNMALLYVPESTVIPLPPSGKNQTERENYEEALEAEIRRLLRASGGRALVLFTSRRVMDQSAARLGSSLPQRVLVQGSLPKPKLIAEFTSDTTSVLFATRSFWQGLDVPGESLSLVIIDRLPFPQPTEPIAQTRRERLGGGYDAFLGVDIPHASTVLAQGVGRLIRTAEDRGVVAVLDRRLAEKGYRNLILDRLPPMRRTRTFDDVEAFFK